MTAPRHFLVASSLAFLPAVALSAEAPERKVSVSGTAVTTVVPDLAVWRLTVTGRDDTLETAKEEAEEQLRAILALREGLGIAAGDLQTGYLSIQKEYKRDQHGNRGEFLGFVVTRTVTIRQRDLKRFDEYLTKLVAAADVEVAFTFDTTRREQIRAETRLKACLAAREKAAAMTGVLGAGLGKVLSLEEGRQETPWQSYASNRSYPDEGGPAPDAVSSETLVPESIEVRVTVSAAFAIE
jgi:hypothetical protein